MVVMGTLMQACHSYLDPTDVTLVHALRFSVPADCYDSCISTLESIAKDGMPGESRDLPLRQTVSTASRSTCKPR